VFELYNDWTGITELSIENNYVSNISGNFYLPELPLVTQSTQNLVGNITFYAGYNFCINFDIVNNLIDLSANDSCGTPLSCSNHFINPSNPGIDCANIISYINGVPPDSKGNFSIAPGPNINLVLGTTLSNFHDSINTGVPANSHSLFIGLNVLPADLCENLPPTP